MTGLISHQYNILLSRSGINIAADLLRAINEIKRKRAISIEPTYSQHSAILEIDGEGWIREVREKLSKLREMITNQEFTIGLTLATQVIAEHQDCWRAYIAKSACLVHLHKYDEADNVLDEVIRNFSSHRRALSHAFQNKGWVSQRRATRFIEFEAEYRVECYRQSISYEPRVAVYINLIHTLLMLNRVHEAESELANCLREFPEARSEFLEQVNIQGADFIEQITKSRLLASILFPKNSKGGK
jgi:hypothetical protein